MGDLFGWLFVAGFIAFLWVIPAVTGGDRFDFPQVAFEELSATCRKHGMKPVAVNDGYLADSFRCDQVQP